MAAAKPPRKERENNMKTLKNILTKIAEPFMTIAVLIDESKRINEDGSWDKYWERKNKKEVRK